MRHLFIFTTHAKVRMLERGITAAKVKLTVTFPDNSEPTFEGLYRATRTIGQEVLEVVYARERYKVIIITVYNL